MPTRLSREDRRVRYERRIDRRDAELVDACISTSTSYSACVSAHRPAVLALLATATGVEPLVFGGDNATPYQSRLMERDLELLRLALFPNRRIVAILLLLTLSDQLFCPRLDEQKIGYILASQKSFFRSENALKLFATLPSRLHFSRLSSSLDIQGSLVTLFWYLSFLVRCIIGLFAVLVYSRIIFTRDSRNCYSAS